MSTPADIPVSHVRDALQGGGIDHEIVLVECAEDYRHVGLLAGDKLAEITWYPRRDRGEKEWAVEVTTPESDVADVSPTAGHMLAAMVRELVAGLRRS